nr:uncharacterized protein LOC117279412 isoform X2 [Nicotiana tomentosiformis]
MWLAPEKENRKKRKLLNNQENYRDYQFLPVLMSLLIMLSHLPKIRGLEAALKRPAKRDEVWKKTHTKRKVGEEAWVEPQAEELARSQRTDEQGQPIMLSEEETFPFWLNVVSNL